MNALAHTTELKIINDEHAKRLRQMRERLIDDVFTEIRRLNKKGYTITVALHASFVTIYIHEETKIFKDLTADYDDTDELIAMLKQLEQLEQIGAPKATVPDVENDIYDLEEETPDAEII